MNAPITTTTMPNSALFAPPASVFTALSGLKACVDLGGTKVAVTLANNAGLHAKRVEPTAKEGHNDALALQIIRMIGESCVEAGFKPSDVDAVGVSSCGPFVLNKGMVELAAPNICGGIAGKARGLPNDWQTALLETPLRAHFPHVRHIRVENDGIGALEAERRWGALQINGKPLANCAYVTWSTGIGTGLCVDGHVLRGKNGNAGHAGHMFVSTNADALCGCGNVGDLEGLVAGNAIPRRFSTQGYSDSATLLIAAKANNTSAIGIIDALCDDMGRAMYNLIVTLDLERISLGGSVFWHHRDYLLPKLQAVISGKLPALTDGCQLVPAGLGDKVGDWGALALVA
jgi:glucokinase